MARTVATSDLVINAADHAPGTVVPAHEHASTYLCVVVTGAFESRAQRRDECNAGSAIAYPAGYVHENRFGQRSSHCVSIHFGPTWTDERWIRDWLRDYHHVGVGVAAPSLRRLDREMHADDSAAPLAMASAAIELLADAVRANAPSGRPAWVVRLIDRIESDLAGAPTLGHLAAEIGLHPAHVSRVFRRACGETLGEYVRRRRLEEAVRALASDTSLAEIAAQAGFADQAHFTRVFRRYFGVSPGAKRRAMQLSF
jgi:AraC family transcriptional regulator